MATRTAVCRALRAAGITPGTYTPGDDSVDGEIVLGHGYTLQVSLCDVVVSVTHSDGQTWTFHDCQTNWTGTRVANLARRLLAKAKK